MLVSPPRFANATPDDPTLEAHHLLAELAVIAITSDHPTASTLFSSTADGADPAFVATLLDGLAASAALVETATLRVGILCHHGVDRGQHATDADASDKSHG